MSAKLMFDIYAFVIFSMASESLAVQTDVGQILRQWDEEQSNVNFDPVPILTRLAEIIEVEAENYLKMDPDPFDERHPSRTDPDCNFGHVLKVLFRKENFMTKVCFCFYYSSNK